MKRFTTVSLFLLLPVLMFAGLEFGVKAGYNANKLSANIDSISSQFRSGMQVGVFFRAGNRFYVQPELYYSYQGAKYQFNDPKGTGPWEQLVNMGSIDIPVLLGVKLMKGDFFNIRVNLGPAVSFLTNKTVKNLNDTTAGPLTGSSISSVNWYIQAGLGADIWLFTFDIRYQGGLNDVIKAVESGGQTWNFNSKNNVFQVSLGFKIFTPKSGS